ncbi:MAG: hypothetical protein WCO57_16795 [Verrucomicrobiota bacterium]
MSLGLIFVFFIQSLMGAPNGGGEASLLAEIDRQFMAADDVILYRRSTMDVYLHPGLPRVPQRYPKTDILVFGKDRGVFLSGVGFEINGDQVLANYALKGKRSSLSLAKVMARLETLAALRQFTPKHLEVKR